MNGTGAQAILRPCAFLDRDGVLNVERGYAHRVEDLAWIENAPQAVRFLNQAGYLVIVVTNQSGIARGLFDEAQMHAFHAAMQADLAHINAQIDAFYFCPFHEAAVSDRYRHPNHPDRKPNPGMLLRAMADWPIDASASFMVGDRDTDMAAAARAGIAGRLYQGGSLLELVEACCNGPVAQA